MSGRRDVVIEALATTLGVLVLIRLTVMLSDAVGSELPLALVPILFMWAPVWVMRRRGEDPDKHPIGIPAFSDRAAWRTGILGALRPIAFVLPFFLLGYHVWHTELLPWFARQLCDLGFPSCGIAAFSSHSALAWRFPADPFLLVAYHLFYVGVPEEIFYRGYVQSRLDERWAPRWNVFGTQVGPSLLVTSLVFALGHSVVAFQWWHVFIFFPSLVFGWLRARTGGIVAGALFHAWANITVGFLDVAYGLQPP